MLPVNGLTWRPKLFQNYIQIPACNDNGFCLSRSRFRFQVVTFLSFWRDPTSCCFSSSLPLSVPSSSISISMCIYSDKERCTRAEFEKVRGGSPPLRTFLVELHDHFLPPSLPPLFLRSSCLSSSCKEHGSPSDGLECARSPFHSAPKAVESSLWAVSGTTTAAATHPLTHPHSFCVCYPVSRPITPLTSQR